MSKKKEFDWFDKPANRKLLWWLLYAVCILLVASNPFSIATPTSRRSGGLTGASPITLPWGLPPAWH